MSIETIAMQVPSIPENIPMLAPQNREAEFVSWEKSSDGDLTPLYNILKIDHPSYQTAVTGAKLEELRLKIPRTPSPYTEVTQSPWHSLGTELESPATAGEVIEAAGMDYSVVIKPLSSVTQMRMRHNDWAAVRTDTGDVLGIVDDDYEPVQNRDAFGFFDTLVRSNEATYETAGVIGRGERIWVLAKLPGYIKVRGNDIVNKYLLLTNSHNGSSRVRVKLTPIRAVCNNTLTAALQGAGEVHVRQTYNAAEDVKQAHGLLGLSRSLFEQLDVLFNRMALTKITDKQLLEYVRTLVPDDEQSESGASAQDIRNDVLTLHESGQGSSLARGTLWGAYNSVTEYTDHLVVDGHPTKRLESIWFGGGEQLKLKAFQLAERMMPA